MLLNKYKFKLNIFILIIFIGLILSVLYYALSSSNENIENLELKNTLIITELNNRGKALYIYKMFLNSLIEENQLDLSRELYYIEDTYEILIGGFTPVKEIIGPNDNYIQFLMKFDKLFLEFVTELSKLNENDVEVPKEDLIKINTSFGNEVQMKFHQNIEWYIDNEERHTSTILESTQEGKEEVLNNLNNLIREIRKLGT